MKLRTRLPLIFRCGAKVVCPECGDEYGNFFTKIQRCGDFGLAYWLAEHPGPIRRADEKGEIQ